MKQIIFLFSLTFSFLLFSCESKNMDEPEIPEIPEETLEVEDPVKKIMPAPIQINLTTNERSMTKDNTDFAVKFFSTIYNNSPGVENIVSSPLSMSMALAVLRNGAEGETKQNINEVMGMKDFPDTEINAYFRKLKDGLTATDSSLSLALANSVWYDKNSYTINSDFVNLSKTWYDAPVTGLDYTSPNALATINKWCEDNTNGLIKEMLGDLSDVEILNALYFKGDWSPGFDFDENQTSKQPFTKSNGAKTEVDMMHKKYGEDALLKYYKDDYLSLVSIPYGNKAYDIYFILPSENITFDEMIKQLPVSGYWMQCFANAQLSLVDLYIPKFKLEYENEDIKEILIKMGMDIACSSQAQFPHIAAGEKFYISRSIQKSFIQVDEKGTEAAAVTEIGMETTANGDPPPPPGSAVFRADRPFLFVIRENSTGTILFMGKVGNPAE